MPPDNISNEPIAWEKKYNRETFFTVHDLVIKGMKDIKLISIINHEIGQDSVDKAPTVPRNKPVHIIINPNPHNIIRKENLKEEEIKKKS